MPSLIARKLRATPTDAEIRLWSRLRRNQIDGYRFRRQQPIGRYVVDFFCPEAKLIVEVDGGQHADESAARADWLMGRGYRLIRFWNNDVLANTEGVLLTIREALHEAKTGRSPPPLRGRVREGGRGHSDRAFSSHASPPTRSRLNASTDLPLKGGGAHN